MERLTIDEIIGHCNREARMYEKACDIKYLETTAMSHLIKEYWEHKQVAGYLKKLKAYEDAEEQGLLLQLPCKVGDKDYIIVGKDISKQTIQRVTIGSDKILEFCTKKRGFAISDIGKKVFLTREEAEAKLKKMED